MGRILCFPLDVYFLSKIWSIGKVLGFSKIFFILSISTIISVEKVRVGLL